MLPADIEKQQFLADAITKIATMELAKKSCTEAISDIKKNIKDRCKGSELDIKGMVEVRIRDMEYVTDAKEAVTQAEEAYAAVDVLRKYFPRVNIADAAEAYVDGITKK